MAGHDTCAICLEKLIPADGTTAEPIGAATCGHCFHCHCFWRWEEAKRQQDWRNRVASRGCPCPVCNATVDEFIRLYIDVDTTDIKKLKKDLKLAKCKLAREKVRLERTRQKLVAITEAETDERSRRLMESSRRALEKDIEELAATASMILNGSTSQSHPPKDDVSNNKERRSKSKSRQSYRKHDGRPVSPPPMRSGRSEQDPPSIPGSRISLPPPPRSRSCYTSPTSRRSSEESRRRGQDAPSRMTPEDAPSSRTVHFRNYCHRPASPQRLEDHDMTAPSSHNQYMRILGRPDPPRTPSFDRYHAQPFNDSFFCPQGAPTSGRSIVVPDDAYVPPPIVVVEDESNNTPSIIVDEDDSPSCRRHRHQIHDVESTGSGSPTTRVTHPQEDRLALSPIMFGRPLLNFLGVGLDSSQGLLGGCIHID